MTTPPNLPNPPTLDLELDELDEVLAKHDRYGGRGAPYVDAEVLRKLIAAARELERVKLERDEARQWVRDLHSGMWINCVYCGHRYGPREKTPVSMADVLKEHIAQCPKHPLTAANARIRELEAERDSYEEVALELRELGESVIHMAEGAMSGNDHWCEQADRFQVLAASLQHYAADPSKGERT